MMLINQQCSIFFHTILKPIISGPQHLQSILILMILFGLPALHAAEIGAACMMDSDCGINQFCIIKADQSAKFCTSRCSAQSDCPEQMTCQNKGGFLLCDYDFSNQLGQMGDSCQNGCADGLLCVGNGDVNDVENNFCSRTCVGAGSCPSGYYCTLRASEGNPHFCAKLNGLPANGEPCVNMQCAEGFQCISSPERTLPYCTSACINGACPVNEMICGADQLCRHQAVVQPKLGTSCINTDSAQESSLVGCENGLECYLNGQQSYCTQPCNSYEPCPDGMGCIYRDGIVVPGDDGLCSPYDESSESLAPLPVDDTDYRFDINPNDADASVATQTTMKETSTSTSAGCDQKRETFPWIYLFVGIWGLIAFKRNREPIKSENQ
jgi:hypothetical protein